MKQLIEAKNHKIVTLADRINFIKQLKTKNGLIDGIGSIAKVLFSTMDASDEKIIKEQLRF